MTDPKFANLPGIISDQPDVYETADDVSDSAQSTSDYYEEPDNEQIERLSISVKDSHNRFQNKYLSGYVDFSDRIGKKSRLGYDATSGTWELSGEGEKESPLQKCRRLQCEMNELLEEVAVRQGESSISEEERHAFEAVAEVVGSSKKILENLRFEHSVGKETNKGEAETKELLDQVAEFRKTGKLVYIPSEDPLAQSSRLAELDQRLHILEKAIGVRPEKLSRLGSALNVSNLIEGAQQLATRAALLQPSHIDLVEARLQALSIKLDSVYSKNNETVSGSQVESAELQVKENKTLELYDMAKRTEPIAQALPDILRRMQALESLHKYANNFTKLMGELEATQAVIIQGISNNKMLLQKVQEAFSDNLNRVNQEVTKLDTRLKGLEK